MEERSTNGGRRVNTVDSTFCGELFALSSCETELNGTIRELTGDGSFTSSLIGGTAGNDFARKRTIGRTVSADRT